MGGFVDLVVATIAALFPVVDPVGSVPLFLVLTAGTPQAVRRRYAGRIAVNVLVLLVVSLLIGGSVLRFFGVSLAVVRIAGGIVVFHAAWRTMNSEPKLTDLENQDAVSRADQHGDIAFMPMTIPLLAGPGSIAVTLGLAAQAGGGGLAETTVNLLAVVAGIGCICAAVFLSLRSSMLLLKWLGAGGIHALSRLLGLFVMAIGVQLILSGLADWVRSVGLVAP